MACVHIFPSLHSSASKHGGAAAHPFKGLRQAPQQMQHSEDGCRHSMRIAPLRAFAPNMYCPYSPQMGTLSGDRRGPKATSRYDVLGLGEAMVDYSGMVSAEYLQQIGLKAGGRRVISVEERAQTIDELESHNFQLNAGGSLANTLSGMAVLSRAAHVADPSTVPAPRIGMAGCIGSDALGSYFQQQLASSGVEWVGAAHPDTTTGTVVVLTTPDAQRSFLSFPGKGSLHLCPVTASGLAWSRITVIEGYLWEMPNAEESIFRAIALARAAGSIVVITAADVSVVKRHRTAMLRAAAAADLLFSNGEEARALVDGGIEGVNHAYAELQQMSWGGAQTGKRPVAEQDCLQLGQICPMVVVTRGSRGSCIASLGQLNVVPPHWAENAPVDTCGAGDAFAAGFLYAYLRGFTVRQMGEVGALCASSVLGRQGPKLLDEDARLLVASLKSRSEGAMSTAGASL